MTKESAYKMQEGLSRNQRVAHFLNWAAIHNPHHLYPYTAIVKYAMGYSHQPREANREVIDVREQMSSVRNFVFKMFQRGLVSVPSQGVRATVDHFDFTKHCVSKTASRLNTISKRLEEQVDIVDVSTFPKNEEGKKYTLFIKDTKSAIKTLADPSFIQKLLPPSNKEEKKESD